ncbi:MAG: lipoate--protein ligase family protein [Symbiobacterium sp.]|uniref:biotin/lipoate A/B protein ligase family protein n=1 Tax=Symbiobacterium sp. TaxID=1971213 RepID=UPI0034646B26
MAVRETHWRLLDTGHRPGPENMAIDEAIARAHGRGEVPPTLRFYGWSPPAVSIGYFQSMTKEVDLEAVRAGGYGYVRRPTGGRLIFHHMEITYSVVIREDLLPGGVIETYREISQGLLAGLRELGVAAELAGGEQDPRRADPGGFHTACFDSSSAYELQVGGRKVAGSAQTRRDGVILQHGSILLDVDVELLFRLMRLPEGAPAERLMERFRSKSTTLRAALGRQVGYAEVRDALTVGFARALGLTLTPGSLTPAEEKDAQELVETKYGCDNWNLKK